MGLGAVSPTNKARSRGDVAQVVTIPQTTWFVQGQGGLVDPAIWSGSLRSFLKWIERWPIRRGFTGRCRCCCCGLLVSCSTCLQIAWVRWHWRFLRLSLMFVFSFDRRCFPGRWFISRHRHTVTARRRCQTSSGPAWLHRSLHPWPPSHGPVPAKLNGLRLRLSLRAR